MPKTVKQRILDEIGDMHSSFVEAQIDSIGKKAQQLDGIVSEAIRLGDNGMLVKAVDELPETGESGTLYLEVPEDVSEPVGEWFYDSNDGWNKIGTLGDIVDNPNRVLALEDPSKFKPIHVVLGTEEDYFNAGGTDPLDMSENVCFLTKYLENDPAQLELVMVNGEQYRVYSVDLRGAYDIPHNSGLLLIPEGIEL